MPGGIKEQTGKSRPLRGRHKTLSWFIELVITVIVMWIVLTVVGKVLPRIALSQISELTNTQIKAGSVDFRFDGSVFIKELEVLPKDISAKYDNSILKADTVRVHFRVGSLLRFKPRLKEVFVNDFVLRAQYDTDSGKWNLSSIKLEAPQNMRGRMPLIWLENGKVEFARVTEGRMRVIASAPVSAELRPAEKLMGGYSFDISAKGLRKPGGTMIVGSWQPVSSGAMAGRPGSAGRAGKIVAAGRLSSKDIPGFERDWTIKVIDAELNYEPNDAYELKVEVNNFNCPPILTGTERGLFAFDTQKAAETMPLVNALQEFFSRYNPSGRININFGASGNLKKLNDSVINGEVYCIDAGVRDKRFPYAVEHITGQIKYYENNLKLSGLTGRHGTTEMGFEGWAANFGPDAEYHLQITSENMALDGDLYDALTKNEQRFWSAFEPNGVVGINYTHSRLRTTRNKPEGDVQTAIRVELLDVNARYEGFAYPLRNTRGVLFFGVDSVAFSDVVSQWEDRKIKINGRVGFGGEHPNYDIMIDSEGVPLDTTLAEALPAAQREFYNQFEMTGRIDAHIKVVSGTGPNKTSETPDFRAEVFPKNSSIRAKALPVTIEDVSGKVVLKPEIVEIEDLTGRYGGGEVKLEGRLWPSKEQKEPAYCLSMRAKEIEVGEELTRSLPKSISELASELKPGGKVNLTADVSNNIYGDCVPDRLLIECLGNAIECNFLPYPLQDITGTILITGSRIDFDNIVAKSVHQIWGSPMESVMKMTGEVEMGTDSNENAGEPRGITAGRIDFSGKNVRLKGKSMVSVDTVIGYNPQEKAWLSQHFVANFYGGKMIGKLRLNRTDAGNYDYMLETSVAGADLKKFLLDRETGEKSTEEHYSTGSMSGWLSITGLVNDESIRLGRFKLKIIDMEVGKRSIFAKLLAVLNLTEPKDYTFDRMTLDAYIQDNRMFLRQIDLSGKSLALDGSGRLDLKTDEINLVMTARGSRLAREKPSLWESLTEGLGRAVVRVEVKGKANDPQITTKPLPVLKETLKILGTPKNQ
jgi:hypothetical protein